MKNDDKNLTSVLEKPKTQPVEDNSWGEEEEKTGIRKWLMPTIVTLFTVFAVYSVGKKLINADGSAAKKDAAAMTVQVITLPPPPVATPPPPPPKEEVREDKEVEEKEDQAPEPEPAVTTANSNKAGAGGIVIAKGNTRFVPQRTGTGISQAQKDFGVQVAKTIEDALRRHPVAKTAAGIAPKVRAAVSPDGRITGLTLESSTGNPALDKIISEELSNLRTPSIAPEGTKFITVRISLRRPN